MKLEYKNPADVNPTILDGSASHVLRLAATDIKRVSRRKGYIINMAQYHTMLGYTKTGRTGKLERTGTTYLDYNKTSIKLCSVCLGGSIIAGTLEHDKHRPMKLDHFPAKIVKILTALDGIRAGHYRDLLNICHPKKQIPDDTIRKLWRLNIGYYGILSRKQITELITKLNKAANILEDAGY